MMGFSSNVYPMFRSPSPDVVQCSVAYDRRAKLSKRSYWHCNSTWSVVPRTTQYPSKVYARTTYAKCSKGSERWTARNDCRQVKSPTLPADSITLNHLQESSGHLAQCKLI